MMTRMVIGMKDEFHLLPLIILKVLKLCWEWLTLLKYKKKFLQNFAKFHQFFFKINFRTFYYKLLISARKLFVTINQLMSLRKKIYFSFIVYKIFSFNFLQMIDSKESNNFHFIGKIDKAFYLNYLFNNLNIP